LLLLFCIHLVTTLGRTVGGMSLIVLTKGQNTSEFRGLRQAPEGRYYYYCLIISETKQKQQKFVECLFWKKTGEWREAEQLDTLNIVE
jgi:hypothetical protein